MRRYSFHLFLSLLLALTFTSCDSDDNGDGNGNGNGNGNGGTVVGDADVNVSGALDSSFSGSAVFGVDEDNTSFSLALFEGGFVTGTTPTGELVAIGRDGGRPDVGTYDLGVTDNQVTFVGAYISSLSNPTGATFVSSESGTLTITSSSSDRIAGSFSFMGQAISGTGTVGEATVSGTFDAEFASNIPSTSFP